MAPARVSTRLDRLRHVLWRDSSRDESADAGRQEELCRYMWWMRHVTLAAAMVLAVSDGWSGRSDVVVIVAGLLDLSGHLVAARRPERTTQIAAVDGVALIALAAAGLPFLVVLVLAVAMLAWAATFRPLTAIGAFVCAAVAIWTGFATSSAVAPVTGVIGFSLLGLIFIVRMIRLNMGARQAAEREHIVAQGVDAIIWEALPGAPGAFRVSPAAERLLGHPVAAFEAPGFAESLVHPDDVAAAVASWSGRGGADLLELRVRRPDGTYRWFENHTSKVGRSGEHDLVVGVLIDRTDQVEAERNALNLGHMMASSPIGQIMLARRDGQRRIMALNDACGALLGIDSTAAGRPFDEVVDERLATPLLALVRRQGDGGQIELRGADDRIHQAPGRHLADDSCSIDFLDVTDRVEHGQELRRQARQDDLTGLLNRRGLLERLDAWVSAQAAAPHFSLLLLDLDDFKEVNDSLGHATGDRLLQEVGARIAASLELGDEAARLGGDEFAVLLDGCDGDRAAEVAERITELLNQPVHVGDLRLRVRASVGIATFPDDAADAAELVRRADVSMYAAKGAGTGVQRYSASADPFDRDRLALANQLEDAIERDELVLHHQPVIDVATGRIIGTEALVRWQHPRLGLVPPGEFIELAEISGLIRPLTRWAVRRALAELRELTPLTGPDFKVSVNLSVRNLYEHDLLEWVHATLVEHDVPAHQLVLEITESTIMDDLSTAVEVLAGLRALGIRTWIDDFGTGHSSFSRLRSLPVDGVKIDRSFVAGSADSVTDRILLRSIIELVGSLGLATVAEGIEDEARLELLAELGCDYAQGFHIARPVPMAQLVGLLAERSPAAVA